MAASAGALGCLTVLMFVFMIIFGCSWQVLGPLEAGLHYDTLAVKYDPTTVYRSGRYMLGPAVTLAAFPMTWQPLMFCRNCSNKDQGPVRAPASGGESPVNVELEVFLYYKLKEAKLGQLIQRFPTKNWHANFISQAKKAIVLVITGLEIGELLTEREVIAQRIARDVNYQLVLKEAYVVSCYIGTVIMAEKQEENYINQWVSRRSKVTSIEQGEVEKIKASTDADVAEERKMKDILLSDQYRMGNTTIEQMKAAGDELILRAQGLAFRKLQQSLNFTQTQLLKYIYYEKIRTTNANLIAGFEDNDKLVDA